MKYLLKALKHRTPLVYLLGAFLSTQIFIVVKLLDSEHTINFQYWYISLLYIVLIPTYIGQYKLISGKWNFKKYIAKMILLNTIPFSILFAFISSQIPKYSFIAIIMLFIGLSTASGLYTLKDFSISGIAYTVSYLLFIYIGGLTINKNTFLIHFLPVALLWLAILGIGLSSNYYVKQNKIMAKLLRNSRKDKRTISEERKKSDMLLLNILPKEIAEELKSKGCSAPQHFEKATVLFTDFVGFTKITEKMTAKELVEELDSCFFYFDSVTKKYNLKKLKQ